MKVWKVAAISLAVSFVLGASSIAQVENEPLPDSVSSSSGRLTSMAAIVKYCVEFVHSHPDEGGMSSAFDAYYDQSAKKVYNNATRVGDQRPQFVFFKCMSDQGYPLQR